ncbi:hypothetical protein [Mycobacterium sp. IDR2000157661]|uniref:hypothetical protein n=1 Tax=Mycobacterium sp. IDR2000157661 TaxID=2867005 RepID=UPI001EEB8408|nr:hypothetical protein [Mycobacterium sp. IDR2000157661]ULE31159.1 hypothetical protein K3G64_00275 [Mycobacterium sp. IDR2000157661]
MTTPAPVLPTIPGDALCELLNAYFVARDDLYEAEAAGADDISRAISRQAVIDLADELVAHFVPDIGARCALTGEDPADLAYTGPALPRPGEAISAIQPGVGRLAGTVEAVTDRGVLVQWQHTNLLPITYPRRQVVPTALGWHIRRT